MGIFVFIVGLVGWFFLLNLFPSLHTSVLTHVGGHAISWFAVLMTLGGLAMARFALGGRK